MIKMVFRRTSAMALPCEPSEHSGCLQACHGPLTSEETMAGREEKAATARKQ